MMISARLQVFLVCATIATVAFSFQQPLHRSTALAVRHARAVSSFRTKHLSATTNTDANRALKQDDSLSNQKFTTPSAPSSAPARNKEDDSRRALQFRSATYDLLCASLVGIGTGFSVALFKLSIEAVRQLAYGESLPVPAPLIPAIGGLLVGCILMLGKLPPGLRGTVAQVDEESTGPKRSFRERLNIKIDSIRKSAAAVFTLGTGCSLGPEGPCVEIGMSVARASMDISKQRVAERRLNWNRILLSCGAAAGVAAGFDAPLAGVFFALEVMQNTFTDIEEESQSNGIDVPSTGGLFSSTSTITPVVISSVLSALFARSLLGEHLIFQVSNYSLPNPLIELPIFLLLGSISGCVAFLFSQAAKLSQSFFSGKAGSNGIRKVMKKLSPGVKPVLGGLFCGMVGLAFPQILFFGYETLNVLLANTSMSTALLLSLLLVKSISTAVSAGSGLVGGTFAPALFLGAMTGASFHNIMSSLYGLATATFGSLGLASGSTIVLADLPAYAMVGSACVLAALFRAPLTASLLLFEISRDYGVILPLIASAGLGSVVADILDDKFERAKERRRDQDSASWGDLSD